MNTTQPKSIATDEAYKQVAHVVNKYSSILATPPRERRKAKLAKLKAYCALLEGKEREVLITYFPDLFPK